MEFAGSIMALGGDNALVLVTDRRQGKGFNTIDTNFQRVFKMQDNILLGLTGIDTDVQTFHALMEWKLNMYKLREGVDMTPKAFAFLIAATLYEHRFGPYYVSPVVAGLQDGEPVICGYDSIGCITEDKFIFAGTASDHLMGCAESFWRPGMNAQQLEDAAING